MFCLPLFQVYYKHRDYWPFVWCSRYISPHLASHVEQVLHWKPGAVGHLVIFKFKICAKFTFAIKKTCQQTLNFKGAEFFHFFISFSYSAR